MSRQAADIVDFAAYRARCNQDSALAPMIPYDMMLSRPAFAMPVLLPVVIGWLPMWMAGVAIAAGTADG
jgi:hypothetical protein